MDAHPKVAILFDGSCRCSIELAIMIEDILDWGQTRLFDMYSTSAEDLSPYRVMILAIPENAGCQPKQPWQLAWPTLQHLSWKHTFVSFCLINGHLCFDEDRKGALNCLAHKLAQRGALIFNEAADIELPHKDNARLLATDSSDSASQIDPALAAWSARMKTAYETLNRKRGNRF